MTNRRAVALLVLLWAAALIPGHSLAQQQEEQSGSKRKVVNRVVPAYPQLARTMNLKGTVRIEVLNMSLWVLNAGSCGFDAGVHFFRLRVIPFLSNARVAS